MDSLHNVPTSPHFLQVNCATVKKWLVKNSAESENLNWILANTKACPKCKRPIEKNQGCMHMSCSQCSHQFCWLCLTPWAEHGDRTGGYYACNRYFSLLSRGKSCMLLLCSDCYIVYFNLIVHLEESAYIARRSMHLPKTINFEVCWRQP